MIGAIDPRVVEGAAVGTQRRAAFDSMLQVGEQCRFPGVQVIEKERLVVGVGRTLKIVETCRSQGVSPIGHRIRNERCLAGRQLQLP